MKFPWPRSLFSRLMLIWLIGIILVLAISITIFFKERSHLVFKGIAQEIASSADMLDPLAPEERNRSLGRHDRMRLRLLRALPEHIQIFPEDHPLLAELRETMPGRHPVLYIRRGDDNRLPEFHRHDGDDRPPEFLRGDDNRSPEYMPPVVAVSLSDGTILTARLPGKFPLPATYTLHSSVLSAFLALVAGVIILTWVCVRISTRPLSRLAAAARALGENPERAPLALAGPTEVIQAAEAFNQMQQRISTHMRERTRLLAAISHDLQTPITRLRLRAEMVDSEDLKTRIQSDLDAMQGLIREGLDYARSMEAIAPAQPIELTALLSALCGDAADMGWKVSLDGQTSAPFMGQPLALRRALWNLIENGVKFGGAVDITIAETPDAFRIAIRDHGPGLPAEERERVFAPFYRTETSRNRETGGTGLGLAITRNLLHAQRGSVTLDNHPGGGLVATVSLPRALRA
ncbi:MAG: HAMP domain-containing protein [Azoarcus sp.]|jgi:protein-histidine pros-kinase|nr:HAMP domain-containing protein [Azoarcus sp.]